MIADEHGRVDSLKQLNIDSVMITMAGMPRGD